MMEVFQTERRVLFTGRQDRSVGPKTLLLSLVFAALLIGVWVLFRDIGQLFVWDHAGGPDIHPAFLRRLILTSCLGIYFVRLAVAIIVFMQRKISWVEAGFVALWISFILAVIAWTGSSRFQEIGLVEMIGLVLYFAGSYLNSNSEYTRYVWKTRKPGRLYTGGLFKYSMHINYLGDVFLFGGLALIARHPALLFIPLFMAANFILFIIPALDCHLARKYGQDFVEYAGRTKRFIPRVY